MPQGADRRTERTCILSCPPPHPLTGRERRRVGSPAAARPHGYAARLAQAGRHAARSPRSGACAANGHGGHAIMRACNEPVDKRGAAAHFLPFLPPLAGVSTSTASSSLAPFPELFSDSSSSFIKSLWIWPLRFSHHCFSASVWALISSRRLRSLVLAAISCADWKMVGPQLGDRALAWRCDAVAAASINVMGIWREVGRAGGWGRGWAVGMRVKNKGLPPNAPPGRRRAAPPPSPSRHAGSAATGRRRRCPAAAGSCRPAWPS